ncbi:hypothetical protein D3C78_475970 [compost metagenome]
MGQYCREQTVGLGFGVFAGGRAGGDQGVADLVGIEGDQTAVALVQLVVTLSDQRAVHLPSKHYI